jgi:hypothetical protein
MIYYIQLLVRKLCEFAFGTHSYMTRPVNARTHARTLASSQFISRVSSCAAAAAEHAITTLYGCTDCAQGKLTIYVSDVLTLKILRQENLQVDLRSENTKFALYSVIYSCYVIVIFNFCMILKRYIK